MIVRILLIVSVLFISASGLCWFWSPTVAFWLSLASVIPAAFVGIIVWIYFESVTRRIHKNFKVKKPEVLSARFPGYKFPDYVKALTVFSEEHTLLDKIESEHGILTLTSILKFDLENAPFLVLDEPANQSWTTDYKKEEFFREEIFFVVKYKNSAGLEKDTLTRLLYYPSQNSMTIEVAASDEETAKEVKQILYNYSLEHSVYKNKTLEVKVFDSNVMSPYDNQPAGIQILFKEIEKIDPGKILLEKQHKNLIKRNIFDFFEHREALRKLGLSPQKGLLFYGPPGTGKTLTCRFIYSELSDSVTTFIVTGRELYSIKSVAQVAKALSPSLVVLEDVDLAFSNREQNGGSALMGEFMDELDGFKDDENVIFLLTTNAIDRVESAIKDRPGRINQCIHFDYPNFDLRMHYLRHFTSDYDASALDLEKAAKMTGRVSQVFLKELVMHAVHIGMENADFKEDSFLLRNAHFEEAYQELVSQNGNHVHSMIGFRKKEEL